MRHAQHWMLDKQTWGVTQTSDISLFSGEYESEVAGSEESFTGYNVNLSLSGHYFGFQLTAGYQGYKREDINRSLLSAGGMKSTLVTEKGQPNLVYLPELPFGFARSNDIEVVSFGLSKKGGSASLYYSELLSDGFTRATIYGVKDQFSFDFVRTGLTNLNVEYGAAVVEDTTEEFHAQGWLGIRYRY